MHRIYEVLDGVLVSLCIYHHPITVVGDPSVYSQFMGCAVNEWSEAHVLYSAFYPDDESRGPR